MKKFGFILLMMISTMFFAIACGDSESNEINADNESETGPIDGELGGQCYPNKTCNDGFVCDENNVCVEKPEELTDDNSGLPASDDDNDSDELENDDNDAELDDDADLPVDDTDDEGLSDEDVVAGDPCEPNVCLDAEHSDGICTPSSEYEEGFFCGCVADILGSYQWYNGKCRKVISKHRCEQLAQLAEEAFPIPDWASTALEFVCYCFSPDTCLALWEP